MIVVTYTATEEEKYTAFAKGTSSKKKYIFPTILNLDSSKGITEQ